MKNLRLFFFAVFLGCFMPVLAYAQGVFIPPRTVFGTVNGITRPISGATITVCAANTAGIPCAPALANALFKDQALQVPLANPTQADANGNYPQMALAGGTYTITESAPGFTGFSAQVTVTCAPGPCTVSSFTATSATITGALNAATFENTCYADQQAGADMGAKIQACITALTNGGIIDATGFTPGSTQVWSGNLFGSAAKPLLIKLGQVIVNINAQQVPGSPTLKIIGGGGLSTGTGTCNTTLVKNFDGSALFAPGPSALQGEVANVCFGVGVTQTSGFLFQPTAGAQNWWIHNVHFQNIYGGFNLTASSATVLTNWRLTDFTFNCFPSTVHTGTFWKTISTDNTVTSSEHMMANGFSSGHTCIMDAPMFVIDSGTDSFTASNINIGPSRTNTSTQPIWVFQNTQGSGIQPRLVSQWAVYAEGDELAGQDAVKITACNRCDFVSGDYSGADHGFNISGGSGIKIIGGNVFNNLNGGVYVTSAVSNLGLKIIAVDFTGNSVGADSATDDIQVADGSSGVDIIASTFSMYPSTVTSNKTRWPINFLGTTSTQMSVPPGNHMFPGAPRNANTTLVRDVTAASGFIAFDDGRTFSIKGPTGSARLWLQPLTTHPNWQLDVSEQCSACFEIIPSTTNGGTTFTNPAISLVPNGLGGTLNIFGSTSGSSAINVAATASGGVTLQADVGTLAIVRGQTLQKNETTTADANVLTVTPAAVAGSYRACVQISVSAATAGVISWTLSWTDSNGAAQSNIAQPLFQFGTAAPNTTFTTSAAGNYTGCSTIDVNNAAAAIVVKWVGGGTTTAKMSATIERLQ